MPSKHVNIRQKSCRVFSLSFATAQCNSLYLCFFTTYNISWQVAFLLFDMVFLKPQHIVEYFFKGQNNNSFFSWHQMSWLTQNGNSTSPTLPYLTTSRTFIAKFLMLNFLSSNFATNFSCVCFLKVDHLFGPLRITCIIIEEWTNKRFDTCYFTLLHRHIYYGDSWYIHQLTYDGDSWYIHQLPSLFVF